MGFVPPKTRLGPTLRKIFERTLILNGGYDLQSGNEAIASGEADLISFGVPFVANPDLPERFRQNAPLNEPVYRGEKVVGVTTSGGFGHATGKSLAFAYVPPDATAEGTEFDIMMFGEMRKARIIPESIWDPENTRIRV